MVIPISDTLSVRPSRSYHPATFGSYRNSYSASDVACRGPLSRPPSGSSRRVALRAHTWSSICPYSSSRCIGSRAGVSHPSYPMPISQCDNVIQKGSIDHPSNSATAAESLSRPRCAAALRLVLCSPAPSRPPAHAQASAPAHTSARSAYIRSPLSRR